MISIIIHNSYVLYSYYTTFFLAGQDIHGRYFIPVFIRFLSAIIFQGHIDSAFFFTMNVGEGAKSRYEPMMQSAVSMVSRLGGSTEFYTAANTLQFSDYSKYHAAGFNEEEKISHHETQFPKDKAAGFKGLIADLFRHSSWLHSVPLLFSL